MTRQIALHNCCIFRPAFGVRIFSIFCAKKLKKLKKTLKKQEICSKFLQKNRVFYVCTEMLVDCFIPKKTVFLEKKVQFFGNKRLEINKKGWKWLKKKFDKLWGAESTWKLVKIHNTCCLQPFSFCTWNNHTNLGEC